MQSTGVTIKDIAKQLDISPSTVSRALKNHPDISPKTKKAVMELARDLNYQPNTIALSLRKKQTNTIGVIIPEIVHFFFSTVISGIEDIAYNAGYNIILCQTNESYEKELIDTRALLQSRVDGILASFTKETSDFSHFEDPFNRGIPIILFDRIYSGLNTSKVIVDDFHGAYSAVKYLIETGCTKIAHLSGPDELSISKDRKDGYLKALNDHGLEVNEQYIRENHAITEVEEGYKIMKSLLELDDIPDAVFSNNDLSAIGAMKAIRDAGLTIPNDISVVGFSDWMMSAFVDPALTTVSQPGFEMGQEACRLFIQQVKDQAMGKPFEPVTKVLKTKLVVRDSTRKK